MTPNRAAAKGTVTQPVHRLNLKDSRHGILILIKITSFPFISLLTVLSEPDMRLFKDLAVLKMTVTLYKIGIKSVI